MHQAGPAGLAVTLANDAHLLEAWGIGEFFVDHSRILVDRIRITASGERIATTLINPIP